MKASLKPSIGIARLGNSPGQFYLAPDAIGGLPYEADESGNKKGFVKNFKDEKGRVRRQGQLFKVYDESGSQLTINSPGVQSIEWNVHLANKKAAWYQYSELAGNLLFGEDNSYKNTGTEFRNATVKGKKRRRKLIIDPGPRTVSGANQVARFDRESCSDDYPYSFPSEDVTNGLPIKTLGELITDDHGNLIVLGGFGAAGGNEPLTSYGGSDTWHDDISDGPVYCTVTFSDGRPPIETKGWVIVGSPDFAPEIVNISNLADTMYDVGVRKFNLIPEMFSAGKYNEDFVVNYHRDIEPIVQRFANYQWVANVQSMLGFFAPQFDMKDASSENRSNRENYFEYFRKPNEIGNESPDQPQAELFNEKNDGIMPMMPINSGSNSVSNDIIVKFLSLDDTQYFLLSQWAKGKFTVDKDYTEYVSPEDLASVGNCVGLPMCPGIEVTWNTQNASIYEQPFVIADHKGKDGYNKKGLNPSRDECEGGGCEPGDLTKRMACPWQADFFQCTVQYVNFNTPAVNKAYNHTKSEEKSSQRWTLDQEGKDNPIEQYNSSVNRSSNPTSMEPLPPSYYSYWWPPQSPWDVLVGDFTLEGQQQSHIPGGQQMNYARGINNFVQMVEYWYSLAFIRDRNAGNKGFPYFTETERNNEFFSFEEYPVGSVSGNSDDNETTIPVFYIEADKQKVASKSEKALRMVEHLEEIAFKSISVHDDGLGKPRSGSKLRR